MSCNKYVLRSELGDVVLPRVSPVGEFIVDCCRRYGDKIAFVDSSSGREYSFNEVATLSQRVSSAFLDRGLKKGDVVCLYAPNSVEYALVLFGVMCAGGIPTTVNPQYTVDEVLFQLEDSKPKFLVTSLSNADVAKKAADKYGRIQETFIIGDSPLAGFTPASALLTHPSRPLPPLAVDVLQDVALLPYSSGTTGRSKGVMLTHSNIVVNVHQHFSKLASLNRLDGSPETFLVFLPLFHLYGIAILFHTLFSGSKMVIMPAFDMIKYLQCIEKYKVTILHIVPPVAILLAKHPDVDKYDLSSAHLCFSGAAPLGADVAVPLSDRLKCAVRQGWGMTETSPVAITCPITGSKHGSVGVPAPGVEAKVMDLDTGRSLPANSEGELWVRGPMVFKGYLNNPENTRLTIDTEGWLHSGDVAYYDEDGHFFVVDRVKELIKYKGFQVAPAELESLLLSHPGVADAAVIGVPDTAAGELPRAYIVLKPGKRVSEADVNAFVNEKVAPHKRLRGGVEFVAAIPKSASGKILRRFIRDDFKKKMKSKL